MPTKNTKARIHHHEILRCQPLPAVKWAASSVLDAIDFSLYNTFATHISLLSSCKGYSETYCGLLWCRECTRYLNLRPHRIVCLFGYFLIVFECCAHVGVSARFMFTNKILAMPYIFSVYSDIKSLSELIKFCRLNYGSRKNYFLPISTTSKLTEGPKY